MHLVTCFLTDLLSKMKARLEMSLRSFVELEGVEDLEEGLLGDLDVVEVDLGQLLVLLADLFQHLVGIGEVGCLWREILQRRCLRSYISKINLVLGTGNILRNSGVLTFFYFYVPVSCTVIRIHNHFLRIRIKTKYL